MFTSIFTGFICCGFIGCIGCLASCAVVGIIQGITHIIKITFFK